MSTFLTQEAAVRVPPVRAEPKPIRPAHLPQVHGARDEGPRRLLARYRRRVLTSDLLSGAVAVALALEIRFGAQVSVPYLVLSAVLPLLWLTISSGQRVYELRFLGSGLEEYRRSLHSGVLLLTVVCAFSYLVRGGLARGYVLMAVPATVGFSLLLRLWHRRWLRRRRIHGHGMNRVLVVGRADAASALVDQLRSEPQHGLLAVGACVPSVGPRTATLSQVPLLGTPDDVLTAVDVCRAHVVAVVSHPDMSGPTLRRLSWNLEERDVELVVSPGIVEVAGPRLSIRPIAGLSLLHLAHPASHGGRMLMKATFDRVLGSVLLLLLCPLMLAITLCIKVTSPGPVLFRQIRKGAEGRDFVMYKFRSMVVDAEHLRDALRHADQGNGMLFKVQRDPRVTRVGARLRRYSLDELPQLLNVLRGDMSLVGPRPPLPEEVAVYTDDAIRRLRVRPGLTGLWQVSGRSDLSWEESLRLDLRYVDNWSLVMDLLILWRTFRAVMTGAGAY